MSQIVLSGVDLLLTSIGSGLVGSVVGGFLIGTLNIQGPQGPQGPPGFTGPTGMKGEPGEPGKDGHFVIDEFQVGKVWGWFRKEGS